MKPNYKKIDEDLEDFWMTFKCCIQNFYKIFKIEDDIEIISNKLNKYQTNKQYSIIEYTIHQYMFKLILNACRMIKHINSESCHIFLYHLRIIIKNVKRWFILRENKIFFKDPIENENIFYIIAECLKNLIKNIQNKKYIDETIIFFKNIDDIIINNDYIKILDYAIEIKNANIIDILSKKYDIIKYINKTYSIELPPTISGKKILGYL